MTSSEGFQHHFTIISKFVCCDFYLKKNVAFTLISFAVLKWDEYLSFQLPFQILSCFIYILDNSNFSSFIFWSSQFTCSSRSNWIGLWTGNANGTWTDYWTTILKLFFHEIFLRGLYYKICFFWDNCYCTLAAVKVRTTPLLFNFQVL